MRTSSYLEIGNKPEPVYRTRIRALGGEAEGSPPNKGQIEKKS
jgi:hypothetical protein